MGERVQENLTASEPQGLSGAERQWCVPLRPGRGRVTGNRALVGRVLPRSPRRPRAGQPAPWAQHLARKSSTEVVAPHFTVRLGGAALDAVPHHNRRGTSMPSSIKWFQTTTGSLEPLGAHGGERKCQCQRNDNIGQFGSDLIRPARWPQGAALAAATGRFRETQQRRSGNVPAGPRCMDRKACTISRRDYDLPKSNDVLRIVRPGHFARGRRIVGAARVQISALHPQNALLASEGEKTSVSTELCPPLVTGPTR